MKSKKAPTNSGLPTPKTTPPMPPVVAPAAEPEVQRPEVQPSRFANPVTIDGVSYDYDTLPETAKHLLDIYTQWEGDRLAALKKITEAKIEMAKNEAALRDLSAEIVALVKTGA